MTTITLLLLVLAAHLVARSRRRRALERLIAGHEPSAGELLAIEKHRGEIHEIEIHGGIDIDDVIVVHLLNGTTVTYAADGRELARTSTNGEHL